MIVNRREILSTFGVAAATGIQSGAVASGSERINEMTVLSRIRNLDVVALFARDMPAMRRFYEDVMEFPLERELYPEWVEYRVGSSLVVMTRLGLMFHDAPTPPGSLSVMLAFKVAPKQVDECAAALVAKGIKLESPPTDQPWQHRTLFFRDPDGNVLEIYADI
ncbi:VOC family protein [Prosthecomicrobium sp. N25]|uniref:VOC family protein n=1 Tax=Prosthecomicrobium sp. N25 TaxID=3129254 RepID=UPI0030769D6B